MYRLRNEYWYYTAAQIPAFPDKLLYVRGMAGEFREQSALHLPVFGANEHFSGCISWRSNATLCFCFQNEVKYVLDTLIQKLFF